MKQDECRPVTGWIVRKYPSFGVFMRLIQLSGLGFKPFMRKKLPKPEKYLKTAARIIPSVVINS